MSKRSLRVVVADMDAEYALASLLGDRQRSLGIKLTFDTNARGGPDLLRYAGRDPGCRSDAAELFRQALLTHEHAVLVFDRDGCGREDLPREEIETQLEAKLPALGWPEGDAAVVVIEPELEAWCWSGSPRVADELGWAGERKQLRDFLEAEALWAPGAAKPRDPKAALLRALREKRAPISGSLYARLASAVKLGGCHDPAFAKLCGCLRRWFPAET